MAEEVYRGIEPWLNNGLGDYSGYLNFLKNYKYTEPSLTSDVPMMGGGTAESWQALHGGTTATPVTTPAYTAPTDYTAPTLTPTANAPILPTGTNVAAATTAATPTYGGATTYAKKSKSPLVASGAWPITNKKYPYKSSLFKTQASELL